MILKLYLNCVYYKATMESSSVCMKLMHKPARGSVIHPAVQRAVHTATSSAAAVATHHSRRRDQHYPPPTMMLLMGMWMSLTKKPMKPMSRKPTLVALAILVNSVVVGESLHEEDGAMGGGAGW